MKRTVSVLLILVLLLSCLPFVQAADKPVTILLGSDFQNNCYNPNYNRYLYDNYLELKRFFAEYMPKIEVLKLEGTYLVWVDISALEFTSDELEAKLRDEGKVYLNSGTMYGRRAGQGYMRINIACPRSRMIDGLTRMAKVLAPYMEDDCDMGCPS